MIDVELIAMRNSICFIAFGLIVASSLTVFMVFTRNDQTHRVSQWQHKDGVTV